MSHIYTRDHMADLLRSHSITPTRQRVEIAYALFSQQAHLSADQIMAIVNTRQSETSKATVYNTLNLFAERRLVRKVVVDPSKIFYDPNTCEHHHFYDVISGHLTDIPAAAIHISGLPALPQGMAIDGIDIIIRTRPAS